MNRKKLIAWLVYLVIVFFSFSGCAYDQGEKIGVISETPPKKAVLTATTTKSPTPHATNTPEIPTPSLEKVEPTLTEKSIEILPTKDSHRIKITIIFDNYPFDDTLSTGWGFAALV